VPRALVAAVLALAALAFLGYAGRRMWTKSDDLLRPVVVLRTADAAALVQPSLGDRLRALTGGARAAAADRPRLVALTFDDGPYPIVTPLLLQTLHDLQVPATFFLIGRDAEQFPDLARAIAAAGDEIGDHTLTHPDLDRLSPAAVTAELQLGAGVLDSIAPEPSEARLFRPPHGRYTLATIQAAQAAGFDTILWNDDPGDWRAIAPSILLAHLLSHATAPEIVLLHSGRTGTCALLPQLVTRYRRAGYTFVTVGALLSRSGAAELNTPAKISLDAEALR
jgi:peptidoglycan/xylan/chitin deacetylase (PgdA/CDA1 family)